MAELATIARPYAEALFQATPAGDAGVVGAQLSTLTQLFADPDLRHFADNPRVPPELVTDLLIGTLVGQGQSLDKRVSNLLRTVMDNGRLGALPEIMAQYRALVNRGSGTSDATIQSAFAIEPQQLEGVVETLERRFNRKLNATVEVMPELIGGIRVVVGDEVLDTSVLARLEQMKQALTA